MTSLRNESPFSTHLKAMTSRAKFDVRTPSSIGGVKARVRSHVQTESRCVC